MGGLAFEEFFQEEYADLVRALYLLTANQSEAEELAQETMARIYAQWDRVRSMDSPGGYAYRVAVNLNRQRVRHLAVRMRRALAMRPNPNSQEAPDIRTELKEAIRSLSTGQREAFLLIEWLGFTAEEAARTLRIAPGSVRARVHRARAVLKERLRDDGGDVE